MNLKETFYLSKLRSSIAMQQLLKDWQPRPQRLECPQCKSVRFVKHGSVAGIQLYLCNSCKRTFRERPIFECNCSIPGTNPKCQDCPQFQEFLPQLKKQVESLRNLNLSELEALAEQYGINQSDDEDKDAGFE